MALQKKIVLVTGASGYIGLHCISELLENDFYVKGSLRDINKEREVRSALGSKIKGDNFEVCELNLLDDNGWDRAIQNCDYLMHIASPCVIKEPKEEKEIIDPAVQGTLRALKAAQKSKVKKVILTSSIGSIVYGHKKEICDPSDWSDISNPVGAYIKSKTLAEKTAWNFVGNLEGNSFKMTSINPGLVFGPILSSQNKSSSVNIILKMIKGEFPALPNIYFSLVDVRDVARLHVDSLTNDKSDFKRIIVSSSRAISFLEISKILRKLGYKKSPLKKVPNQIINFLAIFNKDMRTSAAMINKGYFSLDLSETNNIYNWYPLPLNKTISDMCNSLKVFL
tara:strand:- start:997 stop:2010 length:1014 start_codon:yes stop_codon:yes gene_type:complete